MKGVLECGFCLRYRVFLGKGCVAASAREGRAPGRAKVGRRRQLDCAKAAGERAKTKTKTKTKTGLRVI